MRKDYNSIKQTVSLCLTTTPRGHEYLVRLINNDIEKIMAPINELLLFLEDEHVIVPDESTVDDWAMILSSRYEESYGCISPITRKAVLKALARGYLGVKLVIWD